MSNLRFSASLMCADFFNLSSQLEDLRKVGIRILHYDIMDGHFVPNITLGFDIARTLTERTDFHIDAHLMVDNPSIFMPHLLSIGFSTVIFHIESASNSIFRLVDAVKSAGIRAGVACSPATPVVSFEAVLPYVDRVLILTVDPGFAGQRFIPEALEKTKLLDKLRKDKELRFEIEVDGSVNRKTIGLILKYPVDILVLGTSGLFGDPDGIMAAFRKLEETIRGG